MSFYFEAHPVGFPEFAVPVTESTNTSDEERRKLRDAAAEEATRRLRAEYPQELGAAIVYACHEANPTNLIQTPDTTL